MNHRREEQKRHIVMWLSVGGTMTVIVALWAMILPMQLRGLHLSDARDAARWNTPRGEGASKAASFEDVLAQRRRQLEAIEKNVGGQQAGTSAKIDELRAKIEAASKRNEAAPATNQPANP